MFSLKVVDDAGEGRFQAVVMPEGGGPEVPVCLYVRFPERPAVGTRFTYNGGVWELYEERLAQEGAIEAGNSFWAAKPVEQ